MSSAESPLLASRAALSTGQEMAAIAPTLAELVSLPRATKTSARHSGYDSPRAGTRRPAFANSGMLEPGPACYSNIME